jgi:hypothetical protein
VDHPSPTSAVAPNDGDLSSPLDRFEANAKSAWRDPGIFRISALLLWMYGGSQGRRSRIRIFPDARIEQTFHDRSIAGRDVSVGWNQIKKPVVLKSYLLKLNVNR